MPVITIVIANDWSAQSYHDGLTVEEAHAVLVSVAKDYEAEIAAAAAENAASERQEAQDGPEGESVA